jgi:hypothetical protein
MWSVEYEWAFPGWWQCSLLIRELSLWEWDSWGGRSRENSLVEEKEDAALKRMDHNVATLISKFHSINAIDFVLLSSYIISLYLILIASDDETKLLTFPVIIR